MPEMVDSERTKESLMGYIHETLHGAEEEHEDYPGSFLGNSDLWNETKCRSSQPICRDSRT